MGGLNIAYYTGYYTNRKVIINVYLDRPGAEDECES